MTKEDILKEMECALESERGWVSDKIFKWKKALEEGLDEDPPAYWYKKGVYPGWLYCSNCDEPWSFDTGAPPYCPCCGKKMKKEEVW